MKLNMALSISIQYGLETLFFKAYRDMRPEVKPMPALKGKASQRRNDQDISTCSGKYSFLEEKLPRTNVSHMN